MDRLAGHALGCLADQAVDSARQAAGRQMSDVFWGLLAVFAVVLVCYLLLGFWLSWRESERERHK
jgi:hypothetical protein